MFVNYIIMGLMFAFAGILYAGRTNSGLPAGGVNFEFEAIIGSVLGGTSMAGGIGNVAMSIVGIYVVGIINNVMNLCSVNAFWQQVVKGYRYSDRGTARYLHSQCDYEIHEKALNRLYTDFMIEP